MKRNRIRIAGWLLAAVLLPVIAGCGASSKASKSSGTDAAEAPESPAVQAGEPDGGDGRFEKGREPIRVLYGPRPTTYVK